MLFKKQNRLPFSERDCIFLLLESEREREERPPIKRNCREQSERVASILFQRAPNE
jgi:hypothetical protein